MAESTVNKVIQPSGGGVNPSSYVLLRERVKMFFESLQKHFITSDAKQSKETCHAEFISESPRRGIFTFNLKEILKHVQNDIMTLFTTHNSRLTKFAFTLAETLVVMGIIGVVAALTIPNLNQSTGDREKVAKVKKMYSNLEDALGRATAVYGPFEEWFENDGDDQKALAKRFAERMIEFMKISKNCEFGDGCFASSPLLGTDGDQYENNYLNTLKGRNYYMVITSDGTSLAFESFIPKSLISAHIRIDIDGPSKGKNQIGNDIFDVIICENGLLTTHENPLEGDASAINIDSYATAWVIQNGNMDYLKCDDLNWETKTSCK